MVPLYVATLTRGHPSYEAMISENKLCTTVFKIPLTRGHPSNKARFFIPQGWPLYNVFRLYLHCVGYNLLCPPALPFCIALSLPSIDNQSLNKGSSPPVDDVFYVAGFVTISKINCSSYCCRFDKSSIFFIYPE